VQALYLGTNSKFPFYRTGSEQLSLNLGITQCSLIKMYICGLIYLYKKEQLKYDIKQTYA